ncbi:MAG: bifunctional tetrahydrofolate synthase/dihydrofolate synthase [Halioglobus sp.]
MSNTSLEQWLRRLETLHPRDIELGLERVRTVAQQLDLLPVSHRVVTVAGTNGKGSTVAVLEALLTEAGYRVGAFTSPHLLHFNERIRVNAADASDKQIVDAFAAIDQARQGISLTYFEFATLAALLIFKENALDIIVLEVGLGGRLDAVNIVDSTVSVITSIDLDHQDWLGETRGQIAREKAGIVRNARPVVIAEPDPPPELMESIIAVGAQPVYRLGHEFSVAVTGDEWQGQLQEGDGRQRELPPVHRGALLPENIAAALQAALLLDIQYSEEVLHRALAKSALAGRRQIRKIGDCEYVLDVAHNPASVNKLLEYLVISPCKGKTLCLFSVMSDKDIESIVSAAADRFDAWFLADQPGNQRAAAASMVAGLLTAAGQRMISISKNLRQALRRAQGIMVTGDRLVIFGSFYTVAGVLTLLNKDDMTHEAL